MLISLSPPSDWLSIKLWVNVKGNLARGHQDFRRLYSDSGEFFPGKPLWSPISGNSGFENT
ncbi:hypothetical protein SAMN05216332_101368 [Nitrosospira briensis]|nr:hypothetical protein SAMN05216332_101368 [Nitrosospira briensis]